MIKVEMLMTVSQKKDKDLAIVPIKRFEFLLPIVKFSTEIPGWIDVEATDEQKKLITAGIHKVHDSVIAAIEDIEIEYLNATEPA